MPDTTVLIFIGLVSGFLAGLLGAGGGFATVILLVAAGMSAHEAVGTSLVYTIVIGLWGTIVHLRQGTATWWLALALGIPSAATAVLGAAVADGLSERVLLLSFAGLAFVMGLAFLLRPSREPAAEEGDLRPMTGGQEMAAAAPRIVVGALAGGAAIGLLKGLFGVGGGFMLVPFMVLALRIPERLAVGSSLFAILIGSIGGGLRHASLGNVTGAALGPMIPAGLVASFVGARLVTRVRPITIRRAFVTLMFLATTYLVWKELA